MPSSRFLVVILVLAQIVTQATGTLAGAIKNGVVYPLLALVLGQMQVQGMVGKTAFNTRLWPVLDCVVTIIVSLVALRLLLKTCWRWLETAIPDSSAPAAPREK
jgi:phage gp29-like protein